MSLDLCDIFAELQVLTDKMGYGMGLWPYLIGYFNIKFQGPRRKSHLLGWENSISGQRSVYKLESLGFTHFCRNPVWRKRGNSKENSSSVCARSCQGMFTSGSFHLGWKAQKAAEGERETGQWPTIFRKRRFLGLEWSVCLCVFFARWTKVWGAWEFWTKPC